MSLSLSSATGPIRDFLIYIETIQGKSQKTVDEYYTDLRTFFRFIKKHKGLAPDSCPFEEIDIDDVTLELIRSISSADLYEYLLYLSRSRHNNARTRARKIASLRSFYKYLTDKAGVLETNIAAAIEPPKAQKKLPKFLTLEESSQLLTSLEQAADENSARDLAIISIFLNCGLRVSELVGINLSDIKADTLRVLGKGNKERNVFLPPSCQTAIAAYLSVRPREHVKNMDQNALFLSRNHQRISVSTVQKMVLRRIKEAGLSTEGISVHKLRHTAATLMHQYGGVDIRVLQEVLGHSNLSSTQIYTHVASGQVSEAIMSNPLARRKPASKTQLRASSRSAASADNDSQNTEPNQTAKPPNTSEKS